ncbi:MAG TPA: bifunctional nuclease domain-containing protein [Candidatus Nanoarchaeia archaeon]|nr:bifunctional nuclease domain-containing protein [Candidatus Nanoarchaeia archaeon]
MKNKITIILALFLVIIIAMNLYLMITNYNLLRNVELNPVAIKDEPESIPIMLLNSTVDPYSLKDYIEIKVDVAPQTIILTQNCTSIILPLNDLQVHSIKNGLLKRIEVRPTSHDTMKAVMEHYNITLEVVKITELKDGVYLSNLVMRKGNEILNLDSKPSDSIALALRTGNKIWLKKEILDREGRPSC